MKEPTSPIQTSRYDAVVILNELLSPSPRHQTLYEEKIVMMLVGSEDDARERAISYAREQEDSYQNQYSETITHRFKAIKDVQLMPPELETRTTIYSRLFSNIETYEAFDAGGGGLDVA